MRLTFKKIEERLSDFSGCHTIKDFMDVFSMLPGKNTINPNMSPIIFIFNPQTYPV